MKVKLLKKLRRIGRDQITIYSVTKTNGVVTGMKIGYNDSIYSKLFDLGDTKEEVLKQAERIYIKSRMESLRKKYRSKINPTSLIKR